jgi:hypothetical protein
MTTTTVDMMSEAWINKIEAETKPSEQTFKTSTKMAVKKTSSSLATRGLDSFLAFQSKEFISGYQNLVTIQPLNKSKTRGWFVRNSDLDTCGWSATESQFAKRFSSLELQANFWYGSQYFSGRRTQFH